jgi:hypothetical protein
MKAVLSVDLEFGRFIRVFRLDVLVDASGAESFFGGTELSP